MMAVDWGTGARGPQYATAAANTELIGRQTGLLLLRIIKNGMDPKMIHLIGFSLGAHVAGSASEVLKTNGYLLGRITGNLKKLAYNETYVQVQKEIIGQKLIFSFV